MKSKELKITFSNAFIPTDPEEIEIMTTQVIRDSEISLFKEMWNSMVRDQRNRGRFLLRKTLRKNSVYPI